MTTAGMREIEEDSSTLSTKIPQMTNYGGGLTENVCFQKREAVALEEKDQQEVQKTHRSAPQEEELGVETLSWKEDEDARWP